MWKLLRDILSGRYYLSTGRSKHRMTVWDIGNCNVVAFTRRETAWSL